MIQEAFDLAEVEDTLFLRPLLTSSTLGECAEVWLITKQHAPGHAYREPPEHHVLFEAWQNGTYSASMGPRTPSLSFENLAAAFTQGCEEGL